MTNQEILSKLMNNKSLPDDIRNEILNGKNNVHIFSIAKKRVVDLYKVRIQNLQDNADYIRIVNGLKNIVSFFENSNDERVIFLQFITSSRYLQICADESASQIAGVLDFTGLGNTEMFMKDK